MRELKFRGISIRTGKFVYGGLLRANQRSGNCLAIKETICNINNGKPDLIPEVVIPETVGQFTGLVDSNGNEIYEDDCVRFPVHDGATVVWNKETAGFEFVANVHYCERHINQHCEVVGNIHENPELRGVA